jgi:hypothetical protein
VLVNVADLPDDLLVLDRQDRFPRCGFDLFLIVIAHVMLLCRLSDFVSAFDSRSNLLKAPALLSATPPFQQKDAAQVHLCRTESVRGGTPHASLHRK